ncbi:MAG TPA: hypothetical protein VEC96_01255 [Anaerolineae bacterium]|nr:hypothetical protein [Anaerolineae bacterium]
MPNLTDYNILLDAPVELNFFGNNERTFNFNPPNDIQLDNNIDNRPVLSYRVDPSDETQNLQFNVFIRTNAGIDELVNSFTFNGTVSRTIFEATSSSHVDAGNNPIIFRLEDGIGSVTISDVIVWFKRSV